MTNFKKLDDLGLARKTIVSLLGDHGWQLGEHGEWCKHTNFEQATHAPMMIHIPGLTDKGIVTSKLTEFVDLFPTLIDAARLPTIPQCSEKSSVIDLCLEGNSLMPLVRDPNLSWWKEKAFTQYPRGGSYELPSAMGYSMRTNYFRYTEWVHFLGEPLFQPLWNVSYGTELYDLEKDADENWNRANDPDYLKIRLYLSAQLHAGWRSARKYVTPYRDLKSTHIRNDFAVDLNTTL